MEQVTFVLLFIVIIATTLLIFHYRGFDRVNRTICELQCSVLHFTQPGGCENADLIYKTVCDELHRYKINILALGYESEYDMGSIALMSMELYIKNLNEFFEVRRANLTELMRMANDQKSSDIYQDEKMVREAVSKSSQRYNELSKRICRFRELLT